MTNIVITDKVTNTAMVDKAKDMRITDEKEQI